MEYLRVLDLFCCGTNNKKYELQDFKMGKTYRRNNEHTAKFSRKTRRLRKIDKDEELEQLLLLEEHLLKKNQNENRLSRR